MFPIHPWIRLDTQAVRLASPAMLTDISESFCVNQQVHNEMVTDNTKGQYLLKALSTSTDIYIKAWLSLTTILGGTH